MKHIGKTYVTRIGGHEQLVVISSEAHVTNVKSLAEAWSDRSTPTPNHHTKLIEAAHYHDVAKKFMWTVNPSTRRVQPPERHAYRGADLYRYEKGTDYDIYVYWLIRLHHSFKAEYIAEAMADIKEHSNANYLNFARDLYLLITCDWFDSGMLNYLSNAAQEASPREPHPFEEFVLHKETGANIFRLEPNPLEQSVCLTMEYTILPKAQFSDGAEFHGLLKDASWHVQHYKIEGDGNGRL